MLKVYWPPSLLPVTKLIALFNISDAATIKFFLYIFFRTKNTKPSMKQLCHRKELFSLYTTNSSPTLSSIDASTLPYMNQKINSEKEDSQVSL